MKIDGWTGQLVVGLVLGLIWAPCVGPTLGAAATLASQGSNLVQVAAVMAVFGMGAGLPLALIGLGSRGAVAKYRGSLLQAGALGKHSPRRAAARAGRADPHRPGQVAGSVPGFGLAGLAHCVDDEVLILARRSHRADVLAARRVVLGDREVEGADQLVEVRARERHRLHRARSRASRRGEPGRPRAPQNSAGSSMPIDVTPREVLMYRPQSRAPGSASP